MIGNRVLLIDGVGVPSVPVGVLKHGSPNEESHFQHVSILVREVWQPKKRTITRGLFS